MKSTHPTPSESLQTTPMHLCIMSSPKSGGEGPTNDPKLGELYPKDAVVPSEKVFEVGLEGPSTF